MQVLWKLQRAFLREVVDAMPKPRPHQNTVAIVLKVLADKEFVGVESFGRVHRYYPLITKRLIPKRPYNPSLKPILRDLLPMPYPLS